MTHGIARPSERNAGRGIKAMKHNAHLPAMLHLGAGDLLAEPYGRPGTDAVDTLRATLLALVRRAGRDEISLALISAHGLTRAFPVPYPR